jgi:hypothetical protein
VRWRNSDCKTPCGAEGDPEKVPDTFFLFPSPFVDDTGSGSFPQWVSGYAVGVSRAKRWRATGNFSDYHAWGPCAAK